MTTIIGEIMTTVHPATIMGTVEGMATREMTTALKETPIEEVVAVAGK